MSIGPSRSCTDKAGVPSVVFDMIVNSKVIEDVNLDETHKQRDFICQLCIQCLENKYKLECDKRYKLPNVPYIGGDIAQQYIRDKKSLPKIEEVSGNKTVFNNATLNAKKPQAKAAVTFENNRDLSVRWLFVRNQILNFDLNHSNALIEQENWKPSNVYIEPIQVLPQEITDYILEINPLVLMNLDDNSNSNSKQIDINKHIKVNISPFKLQVSKPHIVMILFII